MTAALGVPHLSVAVMLLAPAVLLGTLAVTALLGRRLGERAVGTLVRIVMVASVVASGTALVEGATRGWSPVVLSYGSWFSAGERAFALDFVLDLSSLTFAALAVGICGVVSVFSSRYLHREPGFYRYFVQLLLFTLGITLVALAGSIEVLFAGWELMGLSSVLLVGFFHERKSPVVNAIRVLAVYRASDAAMLSAAVLLHHWAGSGSLSLLFTNSAAATAQLAPWQALTIALLVVAAVAGKSALWPFSGWLPRAMEGPTPSSAVYYGALSIHAGCFLLLRAEPLLSGLPVARALVAMLGVATALYAARTGRVQTDVKSALSYAALTQVGIIVVEAALGWTTVAFVHLVGNASLRLLQFLSAPNVLHDHHELEDEVVRGGVGSLHSNPTVKASPGWYLFALERGFADALLDRIVVRPFRRGVVLLDRMDRVLVGRPGSGGEVGP